MIADFIHDESSVSIITEIEVLGYSQFEPQILQITEDLFTELQIFDLTREISTLAIFLRQQRKMSLGDSIIASTALIENLTLVTRNSKDFIWINELALLNPFE